MPTLTVGLRITVGPVLHMSRPSRVPTSRAPCRGLGAHGSKFDIGWALDQLFMRCGAGSLSLVGTSVPPPQARGSH